MHRCHTVAIVFGILLTALPARADDCSTLPRARMRVRVTVSEGHVPGAMQIIRRIVDDTWQPEGLIFDWVEGFDDNTWKGIDAWVALVPGMPVTDDGGVMGEVLFKNDTPSRLIRVSIDAAIAWVRRDQAIRFGTSTRVNNQTLGETATLAPRALGHIVAHEIGHFVLGTRAHASSGVMRATFEGARRLLMRPAALRLDAANQARLATRLAQSAACR